MDIGEYIRYQALLTDAQIRKDYVMQVLRDKARKTLGESELVCGLSESSCARVLEVHFGNLWLLCRIENTKADEKGASVFALIMRSPITKERSGFEEVPNTKLVKTHIVNMGDQWAHMPSEKTPLLERNFDMKPYLLDALEPVLSMGGLVLADRYRL